MSTIITKKVLRGYITPTLDTESSMTTDNVDLGEESAIPMDYVLDSESNMTADDMDLDEESPIPIDNILDTQSSVTAEDVVFEEELPISMESVVDTEALDDAVSTTTYENNNYIGEENEPENESEYGSHISSSNKAVVKIQGTTNTQSRCFICGSITGRKAIPWAAIQQVWLEKKCFVNKSNRTCSEHLTEFNKFSEEALNMIEPTKQEIDVSTVDFAAWLHEVSDIQKTTPYNFENDGISAELYPMFFGISKENFDDLVQYLPGCHHITREEAIKNHSIKLTSKVLNQSESKLCLIADCTYNYIEKPSDFDLQRKTFSAHKKRNLLKPLYIILPTGYILEAAGPYFCDAKNNDAANIRHHYNNSDILLFLEEDDFFIFDRGFRDVVEETNANGHAVFMPSLLAGKRTHFTCAEANSSRKVTMHRWVIEAVNGRVKNIFTYFKHTIEGTYVPKIMRFNRIACAIINKYFPPLFKNNEFHEVIAEVTESHQENVNKLKEEIEELGIQRMTKKWEKANANSVPDFPQLSMDDLKRLTLGSYQIKIAEKYVEQHLREDSHFGIFVHRENEMIIRAQIQSRFSKSKTHNTWVKFDDDITTGLKVINGYYCSCKVGERTLGCCSHVATVIRYLGYDRYQPPKERSRIRTAWDAIDCNNNSNEYSSADEEDE